MKSTRAAQSSVDISNLSIPAAEEIIEEALANWRFRRIRAWCARCVFSRLRDIRPSWSCAAKMAAASAATPRLTPGRPKKMKFASTSSASTTRARRRSPSARPAPRPIAASTKRTKPAGMLPADMDARVKELCAALAEAERGGHAFIALKWFRDSFLPRKAFRWNQHPESRQAVLAEAIQRGLVITSKSRTPRLPPIPPPPSASTAPRQAFPRRRSASIRSPCRAAARRRHRGGTGR